MRILLLPGYPFSGCPQVAASTGQPILTYVIKCSGIKEVEGSASYDTRGYVFPIKCARGERLVPSPCRRHSLPGHFYDRHLRRPPPPLRVSTKRKRKRRKKKISPGWMLREREPGRRRLFTAARSFTSLRTARDDGDPFYAPRRDTGTVRGDVLTPTKANQLRDIVLASGSSGRNDFVAYRIDALGRMYTRVFFVSQTVTFYKSIVHGWVPSANGQVGWVFLDL
ncbi:hypothetical protein PUN28_015477 [Cardiocondyla obscurior]|uniref:Uncharacterized protein n=1 Tax=Cardiocondyla obscurior TaxID=286306 RepID=A0AAW2EVV5_9HYME